MWDNRWVRVGAVALGFFLINGLSRFISFLTSPDEPDPLGRVAAGQAAIAVVGQLLVVVLMAVAAAWWTVRHEPGRVLADLGLATLAGTVLAQLVGPLLVGNSPFEGGLELFVKVFGWFLGLGAVGIFLGYSAMVVLGKDWRSRGLSAYAERYGKKPKTAGRR